jgi:hypothetical protein
MPSYPEAALADLHPALSNAHEIGQALTLMDIGNGYRAEDLRSRQFPNCRKPPKTVPLVGMPDQRIN